MIERTGLDEAALSAWAAELATWLRARLDDLGGTLSLGLVGELGAGKTTLARALVGALPGGAAVRVSSPTYALVHDYATDPPVRHADLYRLDGPEELEAIGFAEMMAEPGINLVEWVDRVPGALPSEWLEIALAVSPGDVRDIRVRAHGTRLQRTLTQEPLP